LGIAASITDISFETGTGFITGIAKVEQRVDKTP